MNKVLVILGTTSTGKTDLALSLAKEFNGELVSCDSRQVYTGLDIGTGKLPGGKVMIKKGKGFWEMDGVKVWMYDVMEPNKQYTVYNYVKDADKIIDAISKSGKLPIIVGGTGLYLKALLEGLPNLVIPIDLKLRQKLEKLSLLKLQNKLQIISAERWEIMNHSDRRNPRRLVRAIELETNKESKENQKNTGLAEKFNILKIGLTAPREILYQRIDERVVSRINQGMIEEVKELHKNGLSFKRMKQLGLEYGVLADYLENKIASTGDLIKILQGKIHGYARRQITWFKKEREVVWFDITKMDYLNKLEKLACSWYDSSKD